jgi:hypothetical protein
VQHNNFGGNVACTVFKSMLTAVLDRLPDYQCTAEGTVHYDSIGVIQGMRHLPATFTPAPRSGPGVGETGTTVAKMRARSRVWRGRHRAEGVGQDSDMKDEPMTTMT